MSPAQVGRCRRGSRCCRSVVVFVCIERWIGGKYCKFGVVVVVVTMNPFDDGLSRTWKTLVTVVNSESLTSTSSGLVTIC